MLQTFWQKRFLFDTTGKPDQIWSGYNHTFCSSLPRRCGFAECIIFRCMPYILLTDFFLTPCLFVVKGPTQPCYYDQHLLMPEVIFSLERNSLYFAYSLKPQSSSSSTTFGLFQPVHQFLCMCVLMGWCRTWKPKYCPKCWLNIFTCLLERAQLI